MPSVGLRKGSGLELDTDVKSTTWMDFDDCQCFYCSSHHSESDPSDIVCHRHCRYTPPSTWVKTMFKTIQYIYSSYHSYVLAVDGAKKWGMLLISRWPRSWRRRRWLWRINESDTARATSELTPCLVIQKTCTLVQRSVTFCLRKWSLIPLLCYWQRLIIWPRCI